jgi:hypothetical protein
MKPLKYKMQLSIVNGALILGYRILLDTNDVNSKVAFILILRSNFQHLTNAQDSGRWEG